MVNLILPKRVNHIKAKGDYSIWPKGSKFSGFSSTFRKAVDSIISFAKDTYRSIFSREETKTIKSVMEAFGKDKEDYRAIGTFLMFTADKKEDLSNSEYRKAVREVDDIAIGRYEQAQKCGNSIKL